MCVICVKPFGVEFPEKTILKNCFDNNSHGAGFMYVYEKKVYIHKGYTTFNAFYNALNNARRKTGDKTSYVMHFRIATQGYEKCMTHPFPLSSNMKQLKKVKTSCNIGIAHNGVLDLTSDGSKEYSDTMLFITDYLSNIIRSYSWYKDARTVKLIENLIRGSRLAILDKNNHVEILGEGWQADYGCYFSNLSYSYTPAPVTDWWRCYDDDGYYLTPRKTDDSAKKSAVQSAQAFFHDPYID